MVWLAELGLIGTRADGAPAISGIPMSIVWWLVLTAVATWILLRTRVGNWIFAAAAIPNAARNVGVPVAAVKIGLFMFTACAATLFAAVQVLDAGSADTTRGLLKEFEAIIAAVIGGCLLTGGYGSAIGACFGALIFGTVQMGIFYTGVNTDWFKVFLGVMMLIAVLFNNYIRRKVTEAAMTVRRIVANLAAADPGRSRILRAPARPRGRDGSRLDPHARRRRHAPQLSIASEGGSGTPVPASRSRSTTSTGSMARNLRRAARSSMTSPTSPGASGASSSATPRHHRQHPVACARGSRAMTDRAGNGAPPLVELRDIVKRFGSVIALNGVTMKVHAGEVMCLLGDNGAGKSTLIKTLSGVHQPTEGEILIDGEPVAMNSPRDALDRGIATVYQDLAMIPLMSITRNFFMGREPGRGQRPARRLRHRRGEPDRARTRWARSASTCATRPRRSARSRAASASASRSRARSTSARAS